MCAPILGQDGDLRDFADRLLETAKVEFVEEGVVLVIGPPRFEHGAITSKIVKAIFRASHAGSSATSWSVSGSFQWNLPDESRRFYVPDLIVSLPGATSNEEERELIEMVVEITSPESRNTVLNDRELKPKQYAKGGIPLYLLVDHELAQWTLFGLADGWMRYQVAADGAYGEEIPLPKPFGFSIPTDDWPLWRS